MLITLIKDKINLSFESVFALPKLQASQTLYYAIPSQEKMQENIALDINKLSEKKKFAWTEKEKDNVKIEGTVLVKKL